LKNSAEPPLRPESAVRKAARKGVFEGNTALGRDVGKSAGSPAITFGYSKISYSCDETCRFHDPGSPTDWHFLVFSVDNPIFARTLLQWIVQITLTLTPYSKMKWITPDFEQIPVSMECSAYSGDVDTFDV
jgi:hypothetical protein